MSIQKKLVETRTAIITNGHLCPIHRGVQDRIFTIGMLRDCPYIYEEDGVFYIAWQEYSPKEVKSASDHEPSDGYAWPQSTYFWTIDCFSCDASVRFSSGLSALVSGQSQKCPNCDTLHTFVSGMGRWLFAVPLEK